MKKEYLEVGKIVSVHGLRGEVNVQPWCDTPEFLCSFDTLYHFDGTPVEIQCAKVHKGMGILKLAGVDTAEEANVLRGCILFLRRSDVVLEEGVFFVQDLLGMSVIDADSEKEYGIIKDVMQTGANDVYAVEGTERAYMVPAIPDVVLETNLETNIMRIRPLEGLFENAD